MRHGTTDTFDVELSGNDGQAIFAETSACDIIFQGRPARLVFLRDITARKVAEQALLDSELRFRTLLDRANDAVYVFPVPQGRPGRFQEVSERACSMLGYTREEFAGMTLADIDAPEQIALVSEDLRARGSTTFETEHARRTEAWCRWRSAPAYPCSTGAGSLRGGARYHG